MDEQKYPHEIDLGREVPDYSKIVPETASEPSPAVDDDDRPKKTVFPRLYISDIDGLAKIPEEGCCMIRYKRVRFSTTETIDKEGKEETDTTCELEIHAICLPEGNESEEDEGLEEKMGEFLKAKGLL